MMTCDVCGEKLRDDLGAGTRHDRNIADRDHAAVRRMTTPSLPTPRPRSNAELLLEVQLEQAGIYFEREVRFAPPRRWRADFLVRHPEYVYPFLIEVEGGSFTGGHKRGKAYESDCDKSNAATLAHYRLLRFTPAHVDDGRALATIKQALGLEDSERVA